MIEETGGAAVYVEENLSGLDTLAPGDQLLAVDGEPAQSLVARLESNRNETGTETEIFRKKSVARS